MLYCGFHLQKFSDSGFHKLKFPSCNLRPRRRQRWQQERLKGNRFRLAKQQLCTCITLFCALLCCRYTITSSNVLPEFVSFRLGRIWTQDNDSLFFFFSKIWFIPEFNSRRIRQHLANWTKCNENDEVLIHSFSDVFAAAARLRVVAAAGFSCLRELSPRSLLFKFPNPFSVYPGTYYIMLNPAFTAHSLIQLTILGLLEP